ncbi:MAG TPA: hypothetical protein VHL57_04150 [Flavobacteriales bacterium]|jgi:hypothetical protein|nr:hypothetical protein [Flavobacteriales bacterium]
MPSLLDIGPATLERVRPDLVIIRFEPGSVANAASFQLSMDARKVHCADHPHGVMLVALDDVDFSPGVIGKDHYKDQGMETLTRAMAIVSKDPTLTNILELYYALHPVRFPVKFFTAEGEALRWLDALLQEGTA